MWVVRYIKGALSKKMIDLGQMYWNVWRSVIKNPMKKIEILLYVLALPFEIADWCGRTYRYLHIATREEIACECGESISLVGRWRCGCGWTYMGHLLRVCPICSTRPRIVRCYECGLTTRLP